MVNHSLSSWRRFLAHMVSAVEMRSVSERTGVTSALTADLTNSRMSVTRASYAMSRME